MIGYCLIISPSLLQNKDDFRSFFSSHIWNILEELTLSAYMLSSLIQSWYFSSRVDNLFLSPLIINSTSVASVALSYILAVPFYVLIERPTRNFLNMVLFPAHKLFIKTRDNMDEDESEDENVKESKIVSIAAEEDTA